MADAGALTLADYAMQSNDEPIRELIKAILVPESVLNDLPLMTNAALKATVLRLLPEGFPTWNGWGKINQNPNVYKADFSDYQESAYLVRQKIQVDNRLLQAPNWIGDPFELQLMAWRDSLNYELNVTFIENDQSGNNGGNGDAWEGLRPRMVNPNYGVPNRNSINTGGLNLTTSMTDADGQTLMELMGTMLAYVGDPTGGSTVFYFNWLTKERAARAMRQSHMWRYTTDNYDRQIEAFRGAKIRDLGWRKDSETPVVPLNLTAAGTAGATAATAYTEIYAVHYGTTWMRGWQTNTPELKYLGLSTENGVYENAIIDWAVGLMQPNPRAICRAYGIQLST